MKLTKNVLVAAACVLTPFTASARVGPVTILDPLVEITEDTTIFNPAGGATVAITPGATLFLFSEYATTVEAAFTELGETATANLLPINGTIYKTDEVTGLATGGNVVKQGGGILQINSWTGMSGTQRTGTWWRDADGTLGYDYPLTRDSWFTGIDNAPDLQPAIAGDIDGRNGARLNGIQGTFTIEQGTVRLAGFLNVWHDQGDNDTVDPLGPLPPPPRYTVENAEQDPLFAPRMTGVSAIILNNSSVLELTNAPLNVPSGASSTTVEQGSALRVQYLRNLQAGINNNQIQTELVVGTTSEYRAVIHIEQGSTGSIGILSGKGGILKSGAGEFIVLNESTISGSVTVGSGRLVLDSAEGRALASASSFNLAGIPDASNRFIISGATTGSRNGAHIRYLEQQDVDVTGDNVEDSLYKPAYAPAPGTVTLTQTGGGSWTRTITGAELELRNNQTIRNFQSDFAMSAAPTDDNRTAASAIQNAADVTNRGELVIAGTGVGASIILGGNTLTIQQDVERDGFFEGSILGGFVYNADLVDEGGGSYTLAFDSTPGFGTFQLGVTDSQNIGRLTDSTNIASASAIRSSLAATLGLAESLITVTDATLELGAALGWRITVDSDATLDSVTNLNAGRVVLDATSDEAKLALILAGATFAETEIRRGSLIVNAQGLGTSRFNVSNGELRIYQNDTATLQASLIGSGTVRLVASAEIDNGSGELIEINSEDEVGTLNFAQQLVGFTGELIANDGVDVSLSAVAGQVSDTLLNARAITLDSGTGTRGSTLRFNDTDQIVRNLAGDARSRVELGRGTMTLVQELSSRTFLGSITGVGSVIKQGAGNFNFRGVDNFGVGASDFTGALAVQEGTLTLGSANALRNISALALAEGTSVTAAGLNQRISALFGETGSLLNLGAATLTVGVTPDRQADLRQQLQTSFGIQLTLAHNYLGTSDAAYEFLTYPFNGATQTLTPEDFDRGPLLLDSPLYVGGPVEDDFLDGTLGMADQTRLYLERVLFRFDRDGDQIISTAESNQAAATANTLGFSGRLVVTGANQSVTIGGTTTTQRVSINKTGWETLRLLNDAAGAQGNNFGSSWMVVRQGVLEATPGALATVDTIAVLANSPTIDLDGDGDIDAVDLGGTTALEGVDLDGDGAFTENDRAADGTLALFVANGGNATFARVIVGDGNVIKTGEGRLVLSNLDSQNRVVDQYTGLTGVVAGELEITLRRAALVGEAATFGAAFVDEGAVLSLRTDSAVAPASGTNFTYVAPNGITGDGTLRKFGQGTLSSAGNLLFLQGGTLTDVNDLPTNALSFDVREGTLRITDITDTDSLPGLGFIGRVGISTGATLAFDLNVGANAQLAAEFIGAGKLKRTGQGTLEITSDPTFALPADLNSANFTGRLSLEGGETVLLAPGTFKNAAVDILNDGTSLRLVPGAFQFVGLTGEVDTVVELDPATILTLNIATGTDVFLGSIIGGGDLIKTGNGILALNPGVLLNDISDITVAAGTLRATVNGIGNGGADSIQVLAGATLEFNVADGDDETYTAPITGAGAIAKNGLGRVLLSGNAALPTANFKVNQGTLAIEDNRIGNVIPAASVVAGATLEVLLSDNRNLAAQVSGAGNLLLNGNFTVNVLSQPVFEGYIGLTNGADLTFDGSLTAIQTGGLAADVGGSNVTLATGQTLTLRQTANTNFEGQFLGDGALIVGSANANENVFKYLINDGDLSTFAGTVTVDGGALQVGAINTKAITLTNGGSLHLFVDDTLTSEYNGPLEITTGSSRLVKVGLGTLDLTNGLPTVTGAGTFGGLVVREGAALVGVVGGSIIDGGQISLAATGTIAVSVGLGETVTLSQQVANDAGSPGGTFEKRGAGTLILQSGTASANVLVTDGTLQMGLSGAPASVGGSVQVDAGSNLTGTATIADDLDIDGTVSPGYSPGTITVGGNLSFNAGSVYEVEVLGAAADRINFSGTLAIDPAATLRLTGTSPVGTRHIILNGGTIGAGEVFASDQLFTAKTGDTEDPVAYLIENTLSPTAGRVVATVVRATDSEATFATLLTSANLVPFLQPQLLQRLSNLARVNIDATTGQVTEASDNIDGVALTPLGRRLASLSVDEAPAALKTLTATPYLAGIGMAHLSAAADNESIARRTEQRRFDRGYMSVKSREFFVSATSGSWDSDQAPLSAGYNITRSGMLVGWDRDFGPQTVAGLALSLDRSEAKIATGGQADATQFRLHGFAATLLADDATFVEGGAFLGHSTLDVNRGGLAAGASSSPSAFHAGAWVRAGRAALLAPRTSITPFVQFDVSHVTQGGETETGPSDTRLKVGDVDQTDIRGRLGFSLAHAWDTAAGSWRYRLSLDVAYVDALTDTLADATAASDTGEVFTDITASANPLDQGGLLITPALTFGPNHDNTYSISAEMRELDGGSATSLNFTYRRRF